MKNQKHGSWWAFPFSGGKMAEVNIRKMGWYLAAAWTLFLLLVLFLNLAQAGSHVNEQARLALRMTVERDLVFRRWAAGHEGVYVEVAPGTPPNPYLESIPERDITTPSGRELTLVNPAYMMRQVYALGKDEYSVYGRIISLNPLSPANAPDPWEEEALLRFASEVSEITSTARVDGEPILRLIRPFHTEESCLACHGHQGYQVGDLQGGISVATSLAPYLGQLYSKQFALGAGYGLIWLIGLGGIGWASRRLEAALHTQRESEEKYKTLVTEMDQGLAVHEMIYDEDGNPVDYRFIDVNKGFERHTGLKREDLLGKTVREVLPGTEQHWIDKYHEVVTTGETLQYENYSQELDRYYHVISFRPKPGRFAVIATDITGYKKVEARLRQEEHIMEVILASMAEKVVFHNRNMEIRWANQAACDFFRLKPGEVAGKNCSELLNRHQMSCLKCPVKKAMQTGEYHQDTLEFPEGRTLLISAYPVLNADGSLDGVVEVSRDITERARMMAELQRAKEASEEASTAKSRFLANMSHEIRTPMNVIIGMANLASEMARDRDQKEYLEMIRESGAALLTLINDILDFSKIEAQKLELVQAPLHLSQEIEKLVLSLKPQAYEKGLELTCGIDKRIPRTLLGDPVRLNQVLMNLIGNAIKFTQEGQITVELKLEELQEPSRVAKVFFSVSDTGIGIPEDKMQHLFEVFTQVHDLDSYKHEGAGLGLPISKNLVELMGGTLEVESRVGRGSTFSFLLPFVLPGEETQPETETGAGMDMPAEDTPTAAGSGLHILLVEDKPMNRKLAATYLDQMGYQVTAAVNGREAVNLCRQKSFDLILMDIHMPEMNGFEATAAIRAYEGERGHRTPIVAMTAYARQEDRDKCLQAGMDGYLAKPMDPARLYRVIAENVKSSREAAAGLVQEIEVEEMRKRLGGNQNLLQELVSIFLQDCPADMVKLKKGLEEQNAPAVAVAAHGLKGEMGNLGFMSGYRLALELEDAAQKGELALAAARLQELERAIQQLECFFFPKNGREC
jgi:PAS domain S-box-containing protein